MALWLLLFALLYKDALKLGRGLYRCQSCQYEGSMIVNTLFQGKPSKITPV